MIHLLPYVIGFIIGLVCAASILFGLLIWTARGEPDVNGDVERDGGGGTNTFPWAEIIRQLKPTREAGRLKREGKLQPHPTKCKKIG